MKTRRQAAGVVVVLSDSLSFAFPLSLSLSLSHTYTRSGVMPMEELAMVGGAGGLEAEGQGSEI